MAAMRLTDRTRRLLAATLVLALLVAGYLVTRGGDTVRAVAHFSRTVGLYPGSDVRVLGVRIGQVTAVIPEGTTVRVEFEYDARYKVPADARAALITPNVVSDRYVQLLPVYQGGPVLRSGSDIPLDRTAVPVELDQVYRSLNDLNVALGPEGANKDGALTRLLRVGAANLDGQGAKINTALTNFSQAVQTLADGRTDLFGTVANLQTFTTALATSDQQVRQFNTDLASVADQLNAERDELAAALRNLAVALGEVQTFVAENRDSLKANVDGLTQVTSALVRQKQSLEEFLTVAPTTLSNLQLAYNPSSGTLDTRNNFEQTSNPQNYLCSIIRATELPQAQKDQACADVNKAVELLGKARAGQLPGVPPATVDKSLGGILGGLG